MRLNRHVLLTSLAGAAILLTAACQRDSAPEPPIGAVSARARAPSTLVGAGAFKPAVATTDLLAQDTGNTGSPASDQAPEPVPPPQGQQPEGQPSQNPVQGGAQGQSAQAPTPGAAAPGYAPGGAPTGELGWVWVPTIGARVSSGAMALFGLSPLPEDLGSFRGAAPAFGAGFGPGRPGASGCNCPGFGFGMGPGGGAGISPVVMSNPQYWIATASLSLANAANTASAMTRVAPLVAQAPGALSEDAGSLVNAIRKAESALQALQPLVQSSNPSAASQLHDAQTALMSAEGSATQAFNAASWPQAGSTFDAGLKTTIERLQAADQALTSVAQTTGAQSVLTPIHLSAPPGSP